MRVPPAGAIGSTVADGVSDAATAGRPGDGIDRDTPGVLTWWRFVR
ncbi:hypothetical protein ACFQZV_08385 [Microbacterium koreense]|uniref:Uncharacterized protein n=1 Tax=Microbacterium koreense TaxID=323761 RepID=A0ABW2ZRV5_9MICO